MIRRDTMRMLTGQTSVNLRIFYLRKIRVENLSARRNEHFEVRNNFRYPIRYVSEHFRLDNLSRMVCVLYDRYTTLNERIFRSKWKMKNLTVIPDWFMESKAPDPENDLGSLPIWSLWDHNLNIWSTQQLDLLWKLITLCSTNTNCRILSPVLTLKLPNIADSADCACWLSRLPEVKFYLFHSREERKRHLEAVL